MAYNILLVDDDRNFRNLFSVYLSEYYQIIEAVDDQEALSILQKPNEIDVVILDVVLPGIRGTEILQEIKAIAPDIAIIISTAYSSKDVAVAALRGHADDYVEKPFRVEALKSSIEKLLKDRNGHHDLDSCDTPRKVEKVKIFAERNFDKKLSLQDAASTVCLSPKYLSRIFKEHTGESFAQFKVELKVRKAKELLMETGYNIAQISDKLGYQNSESFIRAFARITGHTPSEYRHHPPIPPKVLLKNPAFETNQKGDSLKASELLADFPVAMLMGDGDR